VNPLQVVFLPAAADDIDSAYDYYEDQRANLGNRFLAAVRDQVTRLQNEPEIHGVVHQDVRAACVHRFPYVVYYRVLADRVLIVAVQHGSRDWSNWTWRV
jgi:plasmid stabilization system protein ParE